jgi:TPR repeat protein
VKALLEPLAPYNDRAARRLARLSDPAGAARWYARAIALGEEGNESRQALIRLLDERPPDLPVAEVMQAVARRNDPGCLTIRGMLLRETSLAQARDCLTRAANAGEPFAAYLAAELAIARHEEAEARRLLLLIPDGMRLPRARLALARLLPDDPQRAIALLERAADEGLPEACFELGQLYKTGRNIGDPIREVSAKPEAAWRYFVQAAQASYEPARRQLADFALKGSTWNIVDGETYWPRLRDLAMTGDPVTQLELGQGLVLHDAEEGLKWLRQAAANGYAPAEAYLARVLLGDAPALGVAWDAPEGLALLRSAAARGDRSAQEVLFRGFGPNSAIALAPGESEEWGRKLAEAGEPRALLHFLTRSESPDTLPEFEHWAEIASKHQFPDGANKVAHLYEVGKYVPRNAETAARWYTLAAGAGSESAGRRLAKICFDRGEHDKALDWYLRSHAEDEPEAALNLARLYLKKNDPPQALRWYLTGATPAAFGKDEFATLVKPYADLPSAQLALASKLESGKDPVDASSWYERVTLAEQAHPLLAMNAWARLGALAPTEAERLAACRKSLALLDRQLQQPLPLLRLLAASWRFDEAFSSVVMTLGEAARRGDSAAAYQLAQLYQLGRGLPRNDARASAWLAKARHGRDLVGQLLALSGEARPLQVARLVQPEANPFSPSYRQAMATLGHALAQATPSPRTDMLDRGAEARSPAEAYHWYCLAACFGEAGGRERAEAIKLEPAARQKAQDQALAWWEQTTGVEAP